MTQKLSLAIVFIGGLSFCISCKKAIDPKSSNVEPRYEIEHLDAGKNWYLDKMLINNTEQVLTPCQRLAKTVFRKTNDDVRRGSMNYPGNCGRSDNFLWEVNNSGKGFVIANTSFQNDCEILSLNSEKLVIRLVADNIVYQLEMKSR